MITTSRNEEIMLRSLRILPHVVLSAAAAQAARRVHRRTCLTDDGPPDLANQSVEDWSEILFLGASGARKRPLPITDFAAGVPPNERALTPACGSGRAPEVEYG